MKTTQSAENQDVKTLHTSENAKKLGNILYDLEMLSLESGVSLKDLCNRLVKLSERNEA